MKVSPQLQEKCLAAMQAGRLHSRRLRDWGRRTLISTMSLAAAIALVVTIAFPPNGNTPVAAKTVLVRLAEQVQADGVLSVTFHDVRLEGVSIQGQMQIADDSIAGDVQVSVKEEDEKPPIVVDASLAITPTTGWLLLRRLEVPDPQAQAMIQLFLGTNSPTLLILPEGILENTELETQAMPFGDIRRFAAGEMAQVVREVLATGADLGAVTTPQPDGTTLVTLRIKNVETLRKLVEMAQAATGQPAEEGVDISEDDAKDILGCTLAVVYDPQSQSVKSFSITDVADMKGTITIALQEGGIDPALLDSARVTTPNTRTLDAGILKGLIESAPKE